MGTPGITSDIHKLVDKINDPDILNALKVLLSKQVQEDWWDELPGSVQESIE